MPERRLGTSGGDHGRRLHASLSVGQRPCRPEQPPASRRRPRATSSAARSPPSAA